MSYDAPKEPIDGPSPRGSLSDLEECPLTGEESQFPLKQRKRLHWQWPANDSPFWKYYSLFTTTCTLILLVTLVHDSTSSRRPTAAAPSKPDMIPLESYPHLADTWKKENLVKTKFYRDTRYMSIDHDLDYLWQEHVLMSTGNIRIPSEKGKGNSSLMSISMFHQMHCLAKMRLALQQAREGLIDIGVDWRDDAHWPHCFDYLRSSIMCYADGTLEQVTLQPGPVDDGTFVKVIDGGVETRYCRDTKPLYDLERQYGPNSHYGHEADDQFQVAPGR